jgi:hypothetical protein
VSRARALLVVFGVLVLSGCGSSKTAQTTTLTQVAAPLAVEAIDEPATIPPPGSATPMCPDVPGGTCQPTPNEAEKLQRALTPEHGSEPRAIAELKLPARGPNARARLIAWRNRSGRLCLETQVEDVDGGPFGPCIPGSPCRKICVQLEQTKTGSEALYLLGGAVASSNDRLQVTTDDGRVATYGLTGPVVPEFPGYRVFMLDLGRSLYRRLELLAHDQVVAEESLSPTEIRSLRCNEGPPVLPSQGSQGRRSPLQKCVQRAGSQ